MKKTAVRTIMTAILCAAALLTLALPCFAASSAKASVSASKSKVTVGDDVWIGANAVVLPGVTIGSHSVVAAGAVVTHDVPEHSLVAGVPAVVKRKI